MEIKETNYRSQADLVHLVGLTKIEKVGPKTCRSLLQHFGGAEAVFRAGKSRLRRIPGVGERIAQAVHSKDTLLAAERELEYANKSGIKVVSWFDPEYPRRLKEVCDSPLVMYVKGQIPQDDQMHLAIVGTRKPSPYGKQVALDFARYFSSRGIVVVSGLAFGIDSAAHHGAILEGGATIAVLGHGLGLVYPREHAKKAQEIVETSGALYTEFSAGTKPDAFNFPARNRIISGLCEGVLVVEATEKGGALITARFAFEQNREVFAVPGNIGAATSAGCNRLIRDNIAKLASRPEDVIEEFEHLFKLKPAVIEFGAKQKKDIQYSDREQCVVGAIEKGNFDFDSIALNTGLSGPELRSVILGLEFRGQLRRGPGNSFVLT